MRHQDIFSGEPLRGEAMRRFVELDDAGDMAWRQGVEWQHRCGRSWLLCMTGVY